METKLKKVYISGPMTGIPNLNKDEFDKADKLIMSKLSEGFFPINPYYLNAKDGSKSRPECLKVDIKALIDCNYIFMLPNWEQSAGARLEKAIADELHIKEIQIVDGNVIIKAYTHKLKFRNNKMEYIDVLECSYVHIFFHGQHMYVDQVRFRNSYSKLTAYNISGTSVKKENIDIDFKDELEWQCIFEDLENDNMLLTYRNPNWSQLHVMVLFKNDSPSGVKLQRPEICHFGSQYTFLLKDNGEMRIKKQHPTTDSTFIELTLVNITAKNLITAFESGIGENVIVVYKHPKRSYSNPVCIPLQEFIQETTNVKIQADNFCSLKAYKNGNNQRIIHLEVYPLLRQAASLNFFYRVPSAWSKIKLLIVAIFKDQSEDCFIRNLPLELICEIGEWIVKQPLSDYVIHAIRPFKK